MSKLKPERLNKDGPSKIRKAMIMKLQKNIEIEKNEKKT